MMLANFVLKKQTGTGEIEKYKLGVKGLMPQSAK